ncbi:MAG: YncE family protein [Candidatus Gastranaerophilaceae bacterium]
MRKILILFIVICINVLSASAAKFPSDVSKYIKKDFPKAEIRFDGLVIIGNTLYLPLFPAKVVTPQTLAIKKTAPANKTLKNLPDIVVFNNDFALLRVIEGKDGKRTVLYQDNPFLEVKSGLLPQDLLVPKGLVIPENIRTIIGGLKIATAQDKSLKVKSELKNEKSTNTTVKNDLVASVAQLKDKNLYLISCKSKNIHVMPTNRTYPEYALSMKSIPSDLKVYKDKFLLVTQYNIPELDVISLADEAVIKKFDFDAQGEKIIIDYKNNIAYVATPESSSIYVIDLNTMYLKQKIQVNGVCEKMYLTADCTKIIYVDKNTSDVWSVELNKGYAIKEVGIFPNVSAIAYADNKIYLSSRTKNRVAVIDYATLSELEEIDVAKKPTDMLVYGHYLYILSAQDNVLQVLNTQTDEIISKIKLNSKLFTTRITKVPNAPLALLTSAVAGKYYVVNLDKRQVIKTMQIDVPVSEVVVAGKVKR